jgi:hypothetical protein
MWIEYFSDKRCIFLYEYETMYACLCYNNFKKYFATIRNYGILSEYSNQNKHLLMISITSMQHKDDQI